MSIVVVLFPFSFHCVMFSSPCRPDVLHVFNDFGFTSCVPPLFFPTRYTDVGVVSVFSHFSVALLAAPFRSSEKNKRETEIRPFFFMVLCFMARIHTYLCGR